MIGGKGSAAKHHPPMIWKPKSRAAGKPVLESADKKNQETADAVVRRFGSMKYLNSVDAAALAAQSSSDLQLALVSKSVEENAYGRDACVSAKAASPKTKKDAVMFGDNNTKTGGGAIISTFNPCTGEIPEMKQQEESRSPCLRGKEVLPLYFSLLNFSDAEEGTRQLCNIAESWLYRDEVGPVPGPTPSDLNERQLKLETWWGANRPSAADRIAPFVRILMLAEPNAGVFPTESFMRALECLAEGGSIRGQQLASRAIDMRNEQNTKRAGREIRIVVIFGLKAKCADYVAQNVSFVALNFTAVDMGEDLPLNLRLRQALGPENKQKSTNV